MKPFSDFNFCLKNSVRICLSCYFYIPLLLTKSLLDIIPSISLYLLLCDSLLNWLISSGSLIRISLLIYLIIDACNQLTNRLPLMNFMMPSMRNYVTNNWYPEFILSYKKSRFSFIELTPLHKEIFLAALLVLFGKF
jgi:hypothetical protein